MSKTFFLAHAGQAGSYYVFLFFEVTSCIIFSYTRLYDTHLINRGDILTYHDHTEIEYYKKLKMFWYTNFLLSCNG